jgi:chromosome partitioning protein
LLVDADPQQSAHGWSQLAGEGPTTVVVGEGSIGDIPVLASEYEYVVIDGAPRLEGVTEEAIKVADVVAIPVQSSAMDIWSAEPIVDLCEQFGTKAALALSRGIVGSTLTGSAREALESFGIPVLEGTRQRVSYVRAFNAGASVIDHGDEKAAEEIQALTRDLVSQIDR